MQTQTRRAVAWQGTAPIAIALLAVPVLIVHVMIVPVPLVAWGALSLGIVLTGGIPLASTDLRTGRLPNYEVGKLLIAGLVLCAACSMTNAATVVLALVAAVVVFAIYALMTIADWCGAGDAKFGGTLALIVGVSLGLYALYLPLLALLFSAAARLIRIALWPGRQRARSPHGPALVVAAVSMLIIWGAYAIA